MVSKLLFLDYLFLKAFSFKVVSHQGAWVAQSVKYLTLAQVTISRFVNSSPTSDSTDYLIFCLPLSLCPSPVRSLNLSQHRGAQVAQSVKYLTLAKVKISWFMGSSPALGSVLSAWPALDTVILSLSSPHRSCSVSLSKMNKNKKELKRTENLSVRLNKGDLQLPLGCDYLPRAGLPHTLLPL